MVAMEQTNTEEINRIKSKNLSNNINLHGVDKIKDMGKIKVMVNNNSHMVKQLVDFLNQSKIDSILNMTTIKSSEEVSINKRDHLQDKHFKITINQGAVSEMNLPLDKELRQEIIVDQPLKNHL
jgi:acylphosphatase